MVIVGRALKSMAVVLVALSLSGCLKQWDYDEVQQWYEKKPESFADYMQFAREKAAEGNSERAIALYEEGIRQVEWQYGPDDIRIATAAEELGRFRDKQGMFGESEKAYKRALEVRLKSQSSQSLDVIRTKKSLASVLKKLYKAAEAQDLLDEVSGKKRKIRPEPAASGNSKPAEKRVRRHSHRPEL